MTHLRELAIAIPSNILEDCQSLSDKTNKIGVIARAASIFKVSKIHVYKNKGITVIGPVRKIIAINVGFDKEKSL